MRHVTRTQRVDLYCLVQCMTGKTLINLINLYTKSSCAEQSPVTQMSERRHMSYHAGPTPGMWTETASCETEPVLTPARWRWTPTVPRTKTVPRCFLSCEAETARDPHLRVASSLATATIRRRLSYTRTRRTLWKLTGRSWTNPSRCRQELISQIQEGTQRRRWSADYRLRTNVEQLCAIIVRINEMFKETNYVKTNDQQWYGVVPDSCDVTKDLDAVHVRVRARRIPMP